MQPMDCTFKLSSLLNKAGQLSHLNMFSPIHCLMIGLTVVWDLFSTVFAANLPVRLHVFDKLCPSFASHFTLFTGKHRFIMLFLNVHLQIFIRSSFKAAYDAEKHSGSKLVLLMMRKSAKCDDISLPK